MILDHFGSISFLNQHANVATLYRHRVQRECNLADFVDVFVEVRRIYFGARDIQFSFSLIGIDHEQKVACKNNKMK